MRNYTGYIIDYSDGNLSDQKCKWFEGELVHNNELRSEYNRFKQVNDFMRAKHDLEEVQNDPERQNIDTVTNQMISDFHEDSSRYENIRGYVESSLNDSDDSELQMMLDQAKQEAETHSVDDVTKKWVDEWNTNNQKESSETENRRAFINSSLSDNDHNEITRATNPRKTYTIRIAIFAAAAMIAAIVFIKTLNPSESSEKLYQEYYKPLIAYSSTTRNNPNIIDPFANAVEMYKQGQYQAAATFFSDLMTKDPNSITAHFFGGITKMELGDYKQAIGLLNEVVSKNGEYKKEAQWYLGLAYLKIKETKRAATYFKELAESKGYYQTQAQDLLNHLK